MKPPTYLRPEGDASCRLELWVQPGACRSEICGLHGQRLKIKLAAPPIEGRANRLLIKFLAGLLGLPSAGVELLSGAGGRAKSVRVAAPAEEVRRRLGED